MYLLETVIIDGDTIPVVTLRPKRVSAYRKSRSRRYQRKWDKMHRNVVKVYPYAKVAGDLINEYNRNLELLETEAEQTAYLDQCEEDLKAEFEGDLEPNETLWTEDDHDDLVKQDDQAVLLDSGAHRTMH